MSKCDIVYRMNEDIEEVPTEVPVMTLKNTILFPRAMVPLYIFEDRFKQMLDELLHSNRLMAIGTLDEELEKELEGEEPPFKIAGLGIIRACNRHPDGSAHIIVQGLSRIQFTGTASIIPFRKEQIQLLVDDKQDNIELHDFEKGVKPQIISLIKNKIKLGATIPNEVINFLNQIDDPSAFIDLSAYASCSSIEDKQKILSTTCVNYRFNLFAKMLEEDATKLKLFKKIQGDIEGDSINDN